MDDSKIELSPLPSMHNVIFCSPKWASFLLDRYPKRDIEVSAYVDDNFFYVGRKQGKGIFAVSFTNWRVYIPDGDNYPFFKAWKPNKWERGEV